MEKLWARCAIELAIKNRIVGGVPTDPKLIEGWISANMPAVQEVARAQLVAATLAELPQVIEQRATAMWTTFKRNEQGIFIEGRQIKAMFKESANILREMLISGEKKEKSEKAATKSKFTNLKAKLAERLFVEEDRVYFERPGVGVLMKPDGNEERAIHVMTAQGPRTALKRCDFVEAPVNLKFTLRCLRDGLVDNDLVRTLLEHSAWNGLGADRSQGNGLFEVAKVAWLP